MSLFTIKGGFFGIVATIGGVISAAFGGWRDSMTVLCIIMGVDYLTGIICAAVFKTSPKTETGALSSKIGFKGLLKKAVILLVVLVAAQIDMYMKTTFIVDAVIIGYIANESVSIIENVGLMGVPIPSILTRAIDILKKKSEDNDNDNNAI